MHFPRLAFGATPFLAVTVGVVSCGAPGDSSSATDLAPAISPIENQRILQAETLEVPFVIDDERPEDVQVTVASSDTSLVAMADMEVLGGGTQRELRVSPNPAGTGDVDIVLRAEDVGGNTSDEAFTLSVEPAFRTQMAKLVASDADAEDGFGLSSSIDGDYVVVGARDDDDAGTDSGSAYVYRRSGDAWSEIEKLTASDAATGDGFGRSVDLSGDDVIVGAPDNDDDGVSSGSAYVFLRSGDAYSAPSKLTASDAAGGDYFGASVAIDGDYAVVGAYGDDDAGAGSGSAYLFHRDGGVWTELAKLAASDATDTAHFGIAVAIDGDVVVVGADEGDGVVEDAGAAYVFERSGDVWSEVGKLTAGDGASMDLFGGSVAVDGDHAVVGAHFDDDDGDVSGSAYVFRRGDDGWSEVAKLTASDAAALDTFGRKVAIDGDLVVVGANRNGDDGPASGSAYVFRRRGDAWLEVAKLTADDAASEDRFGTSVSVSGDRVVVGATGDDAGGPGSGAGYVFRE